MGVTSTTRYDHTPQIKAEFEKLAGKAIEVGVFDGEAAWLAGIHEFGCTIPVTDKMRGWFKAQGHPLSPSKKVIVIPERSFIRAGFDANVGDVNKLADQLVSAVAAGQISADVLLDAVGTEMEGRVKTYARDLSSPPDSGFTTERKGSSNPLVDTGNMIGSITHRVV